MRRLALFASAFSLLLLTVAEAAAPQPGEFFTAGASTEKKIALTFDDGPGPETGQVLDALKRHDVRATFFMLGEQAQRRPKVAERVAKDGHEVANHTWNHVNYLKRFRELGGAEKPGAVARVQAELMADMEKSRGAIEEMSGQRIALCRMPHGVDRPWVNEAARKTGFVMVNWTYGADWLSIPEDQLSKSYVKAIRPGAIFLFHDGGRRRAKTIALAEAVIIAAKEQGYQIVTAGELLGLDHAAIAGIQR